MQNHDSRPTGSTSLPEVNAISSYFGGRGRGRGRGHAQNKNSDCNRCGMEGHWYSACRIAKYWVDLYQTSLKEKGKQIETNFIGHYDPLKTTQSDFVSMDTTHLDIADFLTDPNGKMD
ncbi:hypothetical protein CFOL_v3_23499, partial [Cephalotus follicularis]